MRSSICGIALALSLAGCGGGGDGSPDAGADGATDGGAADAGPRDAGPRPDANDVEAVLEAMTLEEKVEQMHGTTALPMDGLWEQPANERLGIPPMTMIDGPRGVHRLAGPATAFPVGMARGATWDTELEERVGAAIGAEAAARGSDVLLAPTINVLRHPAWGRAQETYGEDPQHIGAMGAAFIRGAQRHALASAKHFALNSIEETRYDVSVVADERTLREVYLPPFRMAVQAGVGSVMSAYNKVNGSYCAENAHLLSDILKGEWGFSGFVESDWVWGTRSTVASANAGLDIEMPSASYYDEDLVDAVRAGEVPEAAIDDSVRRILTAKRTIRESYAEAPPLDVVESAEHRMLAREVALESIVLLKNEAGVLPLERDSVGSVAVVGSLSDVANMGDDGSSVVEPSEAVSPLAGLQAHAEGVTVEHVPSDTLGAADETAVANADAAVVVVGLTAEDEGEFIRDGDPGDRETLSLSPEHEALVAAVAALQPRTIVVLQGGSAITVEAWIDDVAAVLMAWYPGMEGGHALAALLFGEASPSGRLPVTVPTSPEQLPVFDKESLEVRYDYLHGYRYVDHEGHTPRYPFGYGLGYTTFTYDALTLDADAITADGSVEASVQITNTGAMAAEEVVQLYVGYEGFAVQRAPLELEAFARVALAPGETKTVRLLLEGRDLAYWDADAGGWRVAPGTYPVRVGPHSRELPLEASVRVD